MGWMVEKTPSTHRSIDHLGSQFLFSRLADALPLVLVSMVVILRRMGVARWASGCLPTRVPSLEE